MCMVCLAAFRRRGRSCGRPAAILRCLLQAGCREVWVAVGGPSRPVAQHRQARLWCWAMRVLPAARCAVSCQRHAHALPLPRRACSTPRARCGRSTGGSTTQPTSARRCGAAQGNGRQQRTHWPLPSLVHCGGCCRCAAGHCAGRGAAAVRRAPPQRPGLAAAHCPPLAARLSPARACPCRTRWWPATRAWRTMASTPSAATSWTSSSELAANSACALHDAPRSRHARRGDSCAADPWPAAAAGSGSACTRRPIMHSCVQ